MSPTRRDILRTSAGAVATALTVSGVASRAVEPVAAAPEPLRISSIDQFTIFATMSDGRQATIGFARFPDIGPGYGAIATLGDTIDDGDSYSLNDDLVCALTSEARRILRGGLSKATGIEVTR